MSSRHIVWMFTLAVLLAAGWLSTARSSDKPTTVYTGTLGTHQIVMELPRLLTDILQARYFYVRHPIDIGLGGNVAPNGHLLLEEDRSSNDFDLVRQPDGGWKGTWKNAQGSKLPVLLHPAILPPLPANAPDFLKHARESMPYVYLRLRKMGLVREKQQSFTGHHLQWWREPISGIRLFRIEDGYPTAQRQRINQALMNRLWSEVDTYYQCVGGDGEGGDYKQHVEPTFLGASAISIVELVDSYCGGAYPTLVRSAINLDAHTGKKLWLDDILWIGKGQPFHYAPLPGEPEDSPANLDRLGRWADHQKQFFVPWLIRQLKKRYPRQMMGDKDHCGYTDDPDAWVFANWYLTPSGVFFIPTFPHAAENCTMTDHWSLLPYSEIRKHPGRLRVVPQSEYRSR
jgi:hypothetical protein